MDCFELFQYACCEYPDKPALNGVEGSIELSSISYRQLSMNIARVHGALWKLGVRSNDVVLIPFSNSPEAIVVILACISLGALAVPVSPDLPQEALKNIINDVKPFLAVVERAVVESNSDLRSYSYSTLLEEADATAYIFQSKSSDPVLLMHTSGSTGRPRKILYTISQIINFMARQNYIFHQYSDERAKKVFESDLISTLPLFHFGGLCLCLQGLMMGRTTHLLKNFLPKDYLSLVLKKKVQLLIMVPSMYELLLDSIQLNDVDPKVKYCITIGEPCSEKLSAEIKKYLNSQVLCAYGLSECITGIGHHQSLIDKNRVPVDSCGRLLFGEVRLMNSEGGESDFGELWVRNDTAYACYSDQSLNAISFEQGWFKTGDLLRRDKLGNYFHCGRKDNMFIVNGKNIYPLEVENIFTQHVDVKFAVVLPLLTVTGKTFPGLILTLKNHHEKMMLTRESLIDYYLNKGSIHSTPGWVLIIEDLPLNGSGKIDRIKCNELLQNEYESHYCRIAS